MAHSDRESRGTNKVLVETRRDLNEGELEILLSHRLGQCPVWPTQSLRFGHSRTTVSRFRPEPACRYLAVADQSSDHLWSQAKLSSTWIRCFLLPILANEHSRENQLTTEIQLGWMLSSSSLQCDR